MVNDYCKYNYKRVDELASKSKYLQIELNSKRSL